MTDHRDTAARVASGSSSFDLEVGPRIVRVENLPTAWSPFVDEHYGECAKPVDASRHADLVVTVREEDERVVVPLPGVGEPPTLDVEQSEPRRFRLESHWHHGEVDPRARRGELVLTSRHPRRFSMSVENYLRIATQLVLVETNAFLFHGAGVVDEGSVVLFFGPSGAGKSTATSFSAPREVVSDDLVVVELPDGGGARVFSQPFLGAMPLAERRPGPFPLAAGCRLRQAPDDRLERLSPARAVATLSASVPYVHELRVPHPKLTELVARVCRDVPVFDMHFTRSDRFWRHLRDELRAG